MAGAISAGAYSAGVFDFLMEALEAWEDKKEAYRKSGKPEHEWDVPSHDVLIPVVAGASAGGITGALGAVAACESMARFTKHYALTGDVTATMPRLFRAWVEGPCFVDPDGGPALLGVDDLKGREPLKSLLDTTVLWKIVQTSLTGLGTPCAPKRYLAKDLHLFLTQTNTRGVPYSVSFSSPTGLNKLQGYQMLCHADRVHFRVNGVGATAFTSRWADPEEAPALDMTALHGLTSVTGQWETFATATLGTSAFPIGLAARKIQEVTLKDYYYRQWPIAALYKNGQPTAKNLEPDLPQFNSKDPLPYVSIDGGVINNEPFELARWTLMKAPPQPNNRDEVECDRAVIMVDPFPEPPGFDDKLELNAGLGDILRALLPTLKNQVRFKVDDLIDALDDGVHTRFLIAPRRRVMRGGTLGDPEPHAIGCGLLGGFGGFLDEEFRAHDYELGRVNCYYFLRDSFVMGVNTGVIRSGYGAGANQLPQFMPQQDRKPQRDKRQIIPVLPPRPDIPNWPQTSREVVETMVKAATVRGGGIVRRLGRDSQSDPIRLGLPVVWWLFGKKRLREFVRWTVLQDLIRRDQFMWPKPESDQLSGLDAIGRSTLAALANPKFAYRTAEGIAEDVREKPALIEAALASVKGVICDGPRSADGYKSYTLKWRAPTSSIGRVYRTLKERLWAKPIID